MEDGAGGEVVSDRGGDGTSCDLHGSAGGECGVDECGGACGMVVACGCGDGRGETIVDEEVVEGSGHCEEVEVQITLYRDHGCGVSV